MLLSSQFMSVRKLDKYKLMVGLNKSELLPEKLRKPGAMLKSIFALFWVLFYFFFSFSKVNFCTVYVIEIK